VYGRARYWHSRIEESEKLVARCYDNVQISKTASLLAERLNIIGSYLLDPINHIAQRAGYPYSIILRNIKKYSNIAIY